MEFKIISALKGILRGDFTKVIIGDLNNDKESKSRKPEKKLEDHPMQKTPEMPISGDF